jgi:integrase
VTNCLIKNDNASAACKKRLIALLGKDAPTSHGFRHTLQTRLRNVECPKQIRDELSGWAKDINVKQKQIDL